jgi:CBS domain-containing protein
VGFQAGDVEGRGTLEDISVTGARIEQAVPTLKAGTALRLRFAPDAGLTVELRGKVVRETESGFAVEFTHVPAALKTLLRLQLGQAESSAGECTVESFMTKKVITVDPECPATEVLNKLHGYGISCVIVCEEDNPIGLISERDIVGIAFDYASGKGNTRQFARDLMSSSLTTVCTFNSLDEAIAILEQHRIRHLPVVDRDGQLVGLLTQGDLLRAALEQLVSEGSR